ncbi:MAG TPA: SSI family serine proteinase inhibitor [Jiangellaceae bacterium]
MVRNLLALLIAATLAAGCGTDGGDDRTTTGASPADTPTPGPETELTVVLDQGDGTPPKEWTLTCDPVGGSHPDPEAACDTLARLDPEVFEPVPPDAMCTMIYGGPQTAEVTGRWDAEPVDAEFSRENGCEIDRWDDAAAVLGHEGGVSGGPS